MPSFLDILSAIAGGGSSLGTGMQQERDRSNQSGDDRGRTLANIYGTQVGAQSGIYANQANNQTAQYNAHQDALTQALLGSSAEATRNAQVDLDRRKFSLNAPGTRAGQAASGSILQNLQPSRLTGGSAQLMARTPTITGGAINALGPGAREAGRLLESGALAGLKSGDTFDPLTKTDFQGGVLAPPGILAAPSPIPAPNLPAYQGPGGVESALGALGLSKPIIDQILRARNNRAVPGSGVGGDPFAFGPDTTHPPVAENRPGSGELTPETGGRFYVTDPNFTDDPTFGQGSEWGNFGAPDTISGPGDLNGYWDGTQWVSGF